MRISLQTKILYIIAVVCMSVVAIFFARQNPSLTEPKEIFNIPSISAGDSRLLVLNNQLYAIGTHDGVLQFTDTGGVLKKTNPEIKAHWIGVDELSSDSFIVITASELDDHLRISQVHPQTAITTELFQLPVPKDRLFIDPTIQKIGDAYYATYTEIEGAINNGDVSQTNGIYTIHLMRSEVTNPTVWKEISIVVRDQKNLEDGRLFASNNNQTIHFVYEQEVVDRGHSQHMMTQSIDGGNTWSTPMIILPPVADQELGAIIPEGNGFTEFYSSDFANGGSGSYEAARVYKATLNSTFTATQMNRDQLIPYTSALLLDVIRWNDAEYYLLIHHYLTPDRRLILLSKPITD